MTTTVVGPSASLRVARLVAVSLGAAGIILFALDFALVVAQAHRIAAWWSIGSVAALVGASIAVTVFGAFGSPRATTVSFVVLAAATLLPALLVLVAAPPDGLGQQLWLGDLAVIGAAAAGAGLPIPAAIGYLVALIGALAAEAAVLVVPEVRLDTLMHLLQTLFYVSLIMALAMASRRAGRLLDLAVRSAVADVSAAAAAEARRAQRRRVEGLIHDTVIVALLAFGRGRDRAQDARASREAMQALAAIEELEAPASASPAEDPTTRDLVWRLQALTTELEAQIRFDYDIHDLGLIPAPVAAAAGEAMSEAIRNSLRHAGPAPRVARQVTVSAGGDRLRVVVLDDGVGFEPGAVDATRLGIREGIVRRMSLAGGQAQVLSMPGRGTTVVLGWSRS